jgi:hypothetical protein
MKMTSKHVQDAARDEECTLNIAGVCNYDPATSVMAHLPDESNGMGTKSFFLSVAISCSACHDAIDRRTLAPAMTELDRAFYMRRAQTRTWRRLVEKGIVTIKGIN